VIVCGYPPSASFRRRLVLPKISMKELNEKLSVISRVVVHPKYRTIGLGSRLVHDTLSSAGTEYVEMSAVMAKYNPFAEKAGMRRILESLGFNTQLLGSEKYVLERLQSLSGQDVERIRQAFAKHSHPRFMKAFSYHPPFGAKKTYRERIEHLNPKKLAHLIKICGFLMHTKAYLFWKSTEKKDGINLSSAR